MKPVGGVGELASRPIGHSTRGTTNPNRLRRVDNWIAAHHGHLLRGGEPVVVDLGYGASPITTSELRSRLIAANPRVRVIGLEIDPARVAAAQPDAAPPWLEFRSGGFELAGLQPVLVRALNVLRQYDESAVADAWARMVAGLAPGGVLVEGTCDEFGRLGSWFCLGSEVTTTLTLAADLAHLERPAQFAERLPKALIHRNVAGERIHDLLEALDAAWLTAAPYSTYGPRQRFARAVAAVAQSGWPVHREPRWWRQGQLTLTWPHDHR